MTSVYQVSIAREVPRSGQIRCEDDWHQGKGGEIS